MGNDGIVISSTEPTTVVGKFTWLQILPDGTRKWFERSDSGWAMVKEEEASASAGHSHPTHGDINFTGTISANGEACIDSPGEGEYEVGQIESIKVRNGLIVGLTEK